MGWYCKITMMTFLSVMFSVCHSELAVYLTLHSELAVYLTQHRFHDLLQVLTVPLTLWRVPPEKRVHEEAITVIEAAIHHVTLIF